VAVVRLVAWGVRSVRWCGTGRRAGVAAGRGAMRRPFLGFPVEGWQPCKVFFDEVVLFGNTCNSYCRRKNLPVRGKLRLS
jgi:hypothetical protein